MYYTLTYHVRNDSLNSKHNHESISIYYMSKFFSHNFKSLLKKYFEKNIYHILYIHNAILYYVTSPYFVFQISQTELFSKTLIFFEILSVDGENIPRK